MANDDMPSKPGLDRRTFIRTAALGAAGLALSSSLTGCTPELPELMVGTLDELQQKGHLTAEFNGNSLYIRQGATATPVIFSLTCTHKKCTVKWQEEAQEFHCPCHEGKYNAEGKVIDGPPPSPLHRYACEVRGNEIWVLNRGV